MSNVPAVTMQDLELEHAELLPSRETLWCCKPYSHGGGSSLSQLYYGIGNTNQVGLINVSALNGDLVPGRITAQACCATGGVCTAGREGRPVPHGRPSRCRATFGARCRARAGGAEP